MAFDAIRLSTPQVKTNLDVLRKKASADLRCVNLMRRDRAENVECFAYRRHFSSPALHVSALNECSSTPTIESEIISASSRAFLLRREPRRADDSLMRIATREK